MDKNNPSAVSNTNASMSNPTPAATAPKVESTAVPTKFDFKALLKNKKFLIISGVVLVLLILGILFWVFSSMNKNGSLPISLPGGSSTIGGTINLNGQVMPGTTISIGEREYGQPNFTTVITDLPATDLAAWIWNQAENGKLYELQAYLMLNGQVVGESDILRVAAPATDEVLSINVTPSNNPVASGSSTPFNGGNAVISGMIDLNGYIPQGATISVAQQPVSGGNYQNIVSGLAATNGTTWTWSGANVNTQYNLQATLSLNGTTITQSPVLTVTAPAANETLVINSTATAPSVAGTVSGTINFNGQAPSGSSIIIVSRVTGTTPFNVVQSGLSPVNGTSWSWNGAIQGTSYDFQAVLVVNGNDYAISPTLTVTSPASNEVLTINSSYQMPAPPTTPSVSCTGQSNGLWAVQVTFNYYNNAQAYWVRVGDSIVDNRYLDQQVAAQNQPGQTQQSVTTNYVLGSGGTYLAKYAWSPTNTNSLSNYSAWSNTTQFTCPAATSTPSPTPTPTATPTPTPTASPTPTPTPSPTPSPTP